MAADDPHESFVPFARSIFGHHRRDQIHAVDGQREETRLDSFHHRVADLFLDLSGDDLLSVSWIGELLDSFLVCQEEFRVVLFNHKKLLNPLPLDRLLAEHSDRAIKALDVLNAIRSGIDQLRQWQRHLDIVLAALNHRNLGEGQLRRAGKALKELSFLMHGHEEDDKGSIILANFNRSFCRKAQARPVFRSLSWTVSRSWSASQQIHAIGSNLTPPRAAEIASTGGLASPVFAMSSVLLFVTWALVAAIPCQDRGLQAHFSPPRGFPWAGPMMSIHDRIMEESRKKEGRRNSIGLLKEIRQIERCVHRLTDVIEFPLPEAREAEVRGAAKELAAVFEALNGGLDPLERKVREVFHQIVRNRIEGLDSSR